ncbi:MAG: RusA family crossover junction endodeoxyribonuclease [Nitrospiraceae bacterium]|nr:RusA family crossover junction endodeoxyribonuclease [Nitrospiraceae bacterium]MDA8223064.1 RusA family crossover junction endodeoxyribonuclease [Desulfitobacterium hafniense]
MAKQPLSLKVRLPRYEFPRNQWRKKLHASIMTALKDKGIEYTTDQKLELHITLYLAEPYIRFHDVDNRLKDIMDSLQGRMGGSKKEQLFERLIPNDSQIYEVIIEKKRPPIQSHSLGHLEIRKYS